MKMYIRISFTLILFFLYCTVNIAAQELSGDEEDVLEEIQNADKNLVVDGRITKWYTKKVKLPEKRIYLLDVTGSMEGNGGSESVNIFPKVKEMLKKTIEGIKEKTTEVVIIPFTNSCFTPINLTINQKDSILKSINDISIRPGDTNIAGAWDRAVSEIDSTKINYLFLLTDGIHNYGPAKEILYNNLRNWEKFAERKNYYAYYVMLTNNAHDEVIRSIADSTKNMWKIETMNVNATFINTSTSLRQNINFYKTIKIDFTSNHSSIFSKNIGLKISLSKSPYYSLKNVKYDFKNKNVQFELAEKQAHSKLPVETKLHICFNYDRKNNPLVFFTPEEVELKVVNHGARALALTQEDGYAKKLEFSSEKFKEPFMWPLESRPTILEKSLEYIPYKWFSPDTIPLKAHANIIVNDEFLRSKSMCKLYLIDNSIAPINGKLYINGKLVEGNYIFQPKRNVTPIDIEYYIPLEAGDVELDSIKLMMKSSDVDVANSETVNCDELILAELDGEREIGRNWMLWLLWIATIIIPIIAIYWIVKTIVIVIKSPVARQTKVISKPVNKSLPKSNLQLLNEANKRIQSEKKKQKKQKQEKKQQENKDAVYGIHVLENKLFKRWQKYSNGIGEGDIAPDGLLYRGVPIYTEEGYWTREDYYDELKWHKADRRLLIITKDPNMSNDDVWDMRCDHGLNNNCSDLKNAVDNRVFYRHLRQWTYGILKATNGNAPSFERASTLGVESYMYGPIVRMNLKKQPGSSSIKTKTLLKYAETYSAFIKEQFSLYIEADVILCCGASDEGNSVFERAYLVDIVKKLWLRDLKPVEGTNEWLFFSESTGKYVINCWHPSYHSISDKEIYEQMMTAIASHIS